MSVIDDVLLREKMLLVGCCLCGVGLGVFVWATTDVAYTADMRILIVTPESSLDIPPNARSLMNLVGVDISSALSQFGDKTYKDGAFAYLLMSHRVQREVARSFVQTPDHPSPIRLSQYVSEQGVRSCEGQRPRRSLSRIPLERDSILSIPDTATPEEQEAVCFLRSAVKAFKSPKDRTLTMEVRTHSPHLSASVAQVFFSTFERYARRLVQTNVHRQIEFLNQQNAEVEERVERFQNRLAVYEARHQGQGTPRDNAERRRLDRQLRAAERLQSLLHDETVSLKQRLGQQETVVTLLDPPAVPVSASGWPWWAFLLTGSLVGLLSGGAAAFFRSAYRLIRSDR